jgi:ATP adenylyltransferase
VAESNSNIWAPWRMEYIESLQQRDGPACFLCHYRDHPEDDESQLVLWRTDRTLTLMNRYPYTNGHLLVAPLEHTGDLAALSEEVLAELAFRVRDCQRVLAESVHCNGFNVGLNLGRCAGAGLPDHLHYHVVPRWNGDTNFMNVIGNARVIPQSHEMVRREFLEAAKRLGIVL